MTGLWSDLPRRATVLLIGIPFAGLVLSQPWATWLCLQFLHVGAAWEWLAMVPGTKAKTEDATPKSMAMYLFPILSLMVSNLSDSHSFVVGMASTACFYSLMESHNAAVCNHLIKGLVFWTTPLHIWNSLSQDFGATTYLLSVAWNCDTGALLVGRLCKTLLQDHQRMKPPRWLQQISPHKSVEGILGGILAGSLTSALWPTLWRGLVWLLQAMPLRDTSRTIAIATNAFSLQDRFLLGFLLSLLAIIGDLWESSTKRQGGVKDSGKLLPGHGGLLDRFDSAVLPGLCYSYFMTVSNSS